jgi:hypothetical protein
MALSARGHPRIDVERTVGRPKDDWVVEERPDLAIVDGGRSLGSCL